MTTPKNTRKFDFFSTPVECLLHRPFKQTPLISHRRLIYRLSDSSPAACNISRYDVNGHCNDLSL